MTKKKLPRGIFQVGKRYRVRLFVDGVQHSLGMYDTLADARAVLDIARSQKALGTFVAPAERRRQIKALREKEKAELVTVAQWAETWMQALEGDKNRPRSPGTITAYRSTLNRHILKTIGPLGLAEVTEDHITTVIDLARESGPHAALNTATLLRSMFNAAKEIKAGGITESPVRPAHTQINTRKSRNIEEDRTATTEQVREFAQLMPPGLSLAVYLGAWCALRQGEALGLQRQDFHNLDTPDNAHLYVARQWNPKATPPGYTEPKAGSKRRIHIPASLVPMIRKHLEAYVNPEPTAVIFPSAQDANKPVSQSAFDRHWRNARDQVRPGFRFHDLRHTGLTAFARTGATLKEIMARGGHTDVEIAMRYQEAAAERDRELTAKLDEAIGGGEE